MVKYFLFAGTEDAQRMAGHFLGPGDPIQSSHVGLQGVRYEDRSVRLLVILKNC